ncbi:hypothetical protein NE619_03345 [Anaerovorax odorimutans]|uniref:Uncharacterized protein n=1 Tax=Anaerovorax odorimutans TaxID=109327 RepID=A0ABT1RKP2_9FIRM|nr:hypothetical protein [Anaerovorax odorimutans]
MEKKEAKADLFSTFLGLAAQFIVKFPENKIRKPLKPTHFIRF